MPNIPWFNPCRIEFIALIPTDRRGWTYFAENITKTYTTITKNANAFNGVRRSGVIKRDHFV